MVVGGAYDFIGIKMGFFPILENDEYYMLVFDLENGEITVIDHKPDRTPLAGIRDHQDYYKKDTPYKVVKAYAGQLFGALQTSVKG
ncbi:hypothetical protein Hanom_Chr07g00591441 [Helianthus anomalus]